MQNKVGAEVPDAAESAKMIAEVEAISASLSKYVIRLNQEERQRALRMPDGGEAIAGLIAQLLNKYAVTLPGVSGDDIQRDLTLAERLQPLVPALEMLLRLAQDGILEAEAEAWYGTTAGYTALVRLSGNDATLAAELKPAMEFFGVGRKRKARTEPK
ncbi:hypothetical protein A7982_12175 [Minicystis rosea]|nr:hypothetical protein A7982_12175 [Minicystis rosea]